MHAVIAAFVANCVVGGGPTRKLHPDSIVPLPPRLDDASVIGSGLLEERFWDGFNWRYWLADLLRCSK